jgi:hypothetical protein
MKKKISARLAPFLHRKSARQRIILYLIASGYTVADLVKMDVPKLKSIPLSVELDVCRDEVLGDRKSGPAFIFPNGKRMPHTTYYRVIRTTCVKVLNRPMSQQKFRDYINA